MHTVICNYASQAHGWRETSGPAWLQLLPDDGVTSSLASPGSAPAGTGRGATPGAVVREGAGAAAARTSGLMAFRGELHGCLTRRADGLSELTDAILCADGPVRSPAELSVEPEFRRGHGSVYDALAGGRIDAAWLRRLQVAAMPAPGAGDPLMFGIT